MADNNLRVKITASDQASAAIERLKQRLGSIETPANRAASGMRRMGERATAVERFARGKALPSMEDRFNRVAKSSFKAFKNVGRLSGELGALADLIPEGGIFAALGAAGPLLKIGTSIGAATLLTKRWADQGMRLKNTAANIGITRGQLVRYRRVSALSDVGAGTVDQGLYGLSRGLFMARVNKDPAMMQALRQLNINGFNKNGTPRSIASILPQIADKITKLSPQGQALVANEMGLGAGMLPLLRHGGAWIKAHLATLKQQGLTSAGYTGSGKLYQDFSKLDTAALELSNTLGKDFAPALDASVRALTAFLQFLNRIDPGGTVAKVATGFSHADLSRRRQALRYFETKGHYTPAQAAGIVANIQAESSYRTEPPQTGFNKGHVGIAQWDAARRAQILKATGIDVAHATYRQQLVAMQWELTHTQSAAGNAIRRATSAGGAAVAMRNQYENPGPDPTDQQRRIMIANRIFGQQGEVATAPSRALPSSVSGDLAKLRSGQGGTVKVDINHSGVPAGVTTRASADGSAQIGVLRINRAMTTAAGFP